MAVHKAEARWNGTVKEGSGIMRLGSGACESTYSFGSRFGEEKGGNPDEMLGVAAAGCFSMALAQQLGEAGYEPRSIHTNATVSIDKADGGFIISSISLKTDVDAPSIHEETLQECVEAARDCPVAQALAGTRIEVDARLLNPAQS